MLGILRVGVGAGVRCVQVGAGARYIQVGVTTLYSKTNLHLPGAGTGASASVSAGVLAEVVYKH